MSNNKLSVFVPDSPPLRLCFLFTVVVVIINDLEITKAFSFRIHKHEYIIWSVILAIVVITVFSNN